MELLSLVMKKEKVVPETTNKVEDNVVRADFAGAEPPEPPTETLACGMCLIEKPLEVLVPVCAPCASKLELHLKHVMANINEMLKLLYPKGTGN